MGKTLEGTGPGPVPSISLHARLFGVRLVAGCPPDQELTWIQRDCVFQLTGEFFWK